jgi:hypothetical protein
MEQIYDVNSSSKRLYCHGIFSAINMLADINLQNQTRSGTLDEAVKKRYNKSQFKMQKRRLSLNFFEL